MTRIFRGRIRKTDQIQGAKTTKRQLHNRWVAVGGRTNSRKLTVNYLQRALTLFAL